MAVKGVGVHVVSKTSQIGATKNLLSPCSNALTVLAFTTELG